jgi:hypothetical protein
MLPRGYIIPRQILYTIRMRAAGRQAGLGAIWGSLPMLSAFQLWVLSTVVLIALVVVCELPPERVKGGPPEMSQIPFPVEDCGVFKCLDTTFTSNVVR